MKTILLPFTLLIALLSGCSIEQFAMEKDPFVEQKPDKDVDPLSVDSAEYAKNNHGVVNIHRHGPGYDVMMMLNAGESDIIFSMDLPVGGATYMPEISEQMKAQREKGKAPDTIEEEKDFQRNMFKGILLVPLKRFYNTSDNLGPCLLDVFC